MAEAPKKRLTLYEDLLSQETIAEMQAKDAAKQAEAAKKKKDATKPIFVPTSLGKKPNQPKAKPKPNFSSMHKLSSSTSTVPAPAPAPLETSPDKEASSSAAQPKLTQKRGFNDWLANEDEEDFYYDRSRERGGRRKKKKKKKQEERQQTWTWDDIYDPTLPVPFLDYKRSDVEYDINDEWKRRLYEANKRELRRQGKDVKRASSEADAYRPAMGTNRQFAPPGAMIFAPPSDLDDSRAGSSDPYSGRSSPGRRDSSGYDNQPRASFAPPRPPIADINLEESADDVYARRMAMSGTGAAQAQPTPPPVRAPPPIFPPATASPSMPPTVPKQASSVDEEKKAKIAAQIAAMKAKLGKPTTPPTVPPAQVPPMLPGLSTSQHLLQEAIQNPALSADDAARLQAGLQRSQDTTPAPPPPPDSAAAPGIISAAPTFNLEYLARKAAGESMITDTVVEPESEERSSRPGQSGFAERLMKKLGWEKGQGLGASGDGITTAIIAKAEKRKKKSDAEGGGYVVPANMGKIVGGKKAKPKPGAEDSTPQPDSLPDKMTEVIKLEGMLENMDVDHEVAENNLMQEIGDEMGEQYGKVERLFIWRKHAGGNDDVFVKFTSPLSAVRCMKGMDGTEFAENQVVAKFWDAEKFENGEYA
ncbi:hypothetical protein AC579_4148 [Pseudocercospora musae]|uniref:G-patch domain-containing protein n=1 Tax=Pseudocercospora musae TaxID=113226 RepID=A0A139IFG5_9PEZI|nr:hypothetical protein AC579_4148 [Pseudocercospora musae]